MKGVCDIAIGHRHVALHNLAPDWSFCKQKMHRADFERFPSNVRKCEFRMKTVFDGAPQYKHAFSYAHVLMARRLLQFA